MPIKKVCHNLWLSFVSLLLTYLIFEFVVFRFCLHYLPLKIHKMLNPPVRVLAQSSKRNTLPKDYIAILGDSYAAGKGDWLLQVNSYINPPFASKHLIYQKTGTDVISFGGPSYGSIQGLITTPFIYIRYINKIFPFHLDYPQKVLIYFYEGNELIDNLGDVNYMVSRGIKLEEIMEPLSFRKKILGAIIPADPYYRSAHEFLWSDQFIFAPFVFRLCLHLLPSQRNRENNQQNSTGPIDIQNEILLDGKKIIIPNRLQSPTLALTQEEMNKGFYIFEQSARFLSEKFSQSQIFLVYVPSPLACYQIVSSEVSIDRRHQQILANRSEFYDASLVTTTSDEIASNIKKICQKLQIRFVDTRPSL